MALGGGTLIIFIIIIISGDLWAIKTTVAIIPRNPTRPTGAYVVVVMVVVFGYVVIGT